MTWSCCTRTPRGFRMSAGLISMSGSSPSRYLRIMTTEEAFPDSARAARASFTRFRRSTDAMMSWVAWAGLNLRLRNVYC